MKKVLHIHSYSSALGAKYFNAYFLPDCKIIRNSPTPDVVFVNPAYGKYDRFIEIIKVRMKFGWTPILCIYNSEPLPIYNAHWVDYCFGLFPGYLTLALPSEGSWAPSAFNKKHPLSARAKTNFCNFVYRLAEGRNRKLRGDFCKQLMRYKKVDCPGPVLNNMPRIRKFGGKEGIQAKLDFIASYKFTIAFENTSNDYYITEKIYEPLSVGSIPIYWGCRKIEEYINPDCFINCHNYESFAEVIEKIKEIDNNPDLYQQYINAKPVLPNSLFYEAGRAMAQRVQHIAAKALARPKQTNKRINLWKTFLFIWENKNYLIPAMNYLLLKKFLDG